MMRAESESDEPLHDAGPPRRRLSFDPTINLGHILTFFGFVSVGVAGYLDVQKRVDKTELRMEALDQAHSARLAGIERAIDYDRLSLRENLRELKEDVKEIRRVVDNSERSKLGRQDR